jgi:hypothetical protein
MPPNSTILQSFAADLDDMFGLDTLDFSSSEPDPVIAADPALAGVWESVIGKSVLPCHATSQDRRSGTGYGKESSKLTSVCEQETDSLNQRSRTPRTRSTNTRDGRAFGTRSSQRISGGQNDTDHTRSAGAEPTLPKPTTHHTQRLHPVNATSTTDPRPGSRYHLHTFTPLIPSTRTSNAHQPIPDSPTDSTYTCSATSSHAVSAPRHAVLTTNYAQRGYRTSADFTHAWRATTDTCETV